MSIFLYYELSSILVKALIHFDTCIKIDEIKIGERRRATVIQIYFLLKSG